jgi:hypothetical protein
MNENKVYLSRIDKYDEGIEVILDKKKRMLRISYSADSGYIGGSVSIGVDRILRAFEKKEE